MVFEMKKNETKIKRASELRKRAEEKLKTELTSLEKISREDIHKLVHELQVHQIELEMQNEELRKAQVKLEESRHRYADLYDFAPVGYVTLDENGLILQANLTAASLLGIERGFLIKKPFYLYIHIKDKDIFYLHLRKIFESKTSQTCDIRLKTKGGIEFYVRLNSMLWEDLSGNKSYQTSFIDITGQKQAEELLIGERRILEMMARGCILQEALDALITMIERMMHETMGSVMLLDETHTNLFYRSCPNLPRDYVQALDGLSIGEGACSCGTAVYRGEMVIVEDIEKDPLWGKYRDLALAHGLRSCWAVPIYDKSGVPLGTFALYSRQKRRPSKQDIRLVEAAAHLAGIAIEQKQAEEALKTSQAQLSQAEKMSTVGTMVGGVAHELINPQMAIINFIGYCMKITSPDDKRYNLLQRAERQTNRCIDIVNDLLTFSHMEKEGEEFQKGSCAAILEQVLKLLSYRFEKEQVQVNKHYAEDIPGIPMRINSIQQVFLNIIVNALDALKESEKKEMLIDIHKEDEFVRMTISDSGIGIAPEHLPRIFDPFFTTKPPGQGTGLGLSISQGIIETHEGRVTCECIPGQGTTFDILLPLKRKEGTK